MTTEGVRRKLAAILCADVKGYSRLIQDDPEATLSTLSRSRSIFDECSKCLNGRVVDSPGDNILIEFASVSEAVQCAVEIQHKLAQQNAELVEQRRMHFRIGIDVGDVLEKDGALYGNGVNISARLQALIEGGGICISGAAYDQVVNRVPYKFEFIGEKTVKNIETPIRVYRVLDQPAYTIQQPKGGKRKITPAWRTALVAMAMLILVVGAAGWYYFIYQPKQATSPAEKPSIAVLPFTNISGDPDQEYFSDGMTEELINALAKLEGLKVISRTSAFYFKGKDMDLKTIGAKLGVAHVLEGSVRRSGDTLRITAQLIKVAADTHLWTETYDRKIQEVFAIQDDISRSVVGVLKIKLLNAENNQLLKPPTQNMEAYNLYLRGRQFYYLGGQTAIECLQKAVALDPQFAAAYAVMARCYAWAPLLGPGAARDEIHDKAVEAVNKALQLDPNLSEAYAVLGVIQSYLDWDWKAAENSLKKALVLNPNSVDAHAIYANLLNTTGRVEQAITEAEIAIEKDPYSTAAHVFLSTSLFSARKYDQALAAAKRMLEMFPKNSSALRTLGGIYNAKGMHDEAIAVFRQGLSWYPANTPAAAFFSGNLGFSLGLAGQKDEARQILAKFLEAEKTRYVPVTPIAKMYAALGDMDKAFEYMEKAYATREASAFFMLKVMPDFDIMRSDPRFDVLLKKMGLAD